MLINTTNRLESKNFFQHEDIIISFDLQNTGSYAGEEVAQLYLRNLVSQPLRPIKELKGFQKVMLQLGETKTITFTIDKEKLAFYNDKLERVTQPGMFSLMIGSASDDIRLQDNFGLIN